MDWHLAALTRDPFLVEAPRTTLQNIWADMSSVKDRIEQTVQNAVGSRVSQIVFNRGAWGAGKTHAAYYFSTSDNLEACLREGPGMDLIGIYTRCPKDPANAVNEFFDSVVYGISWEAIETAFITVRNELGETAFEAGLLKQTRDPDIARALFLLGSENWNRLLIRRYLLGGPVTTTELKSIGVAKSLAKSGAQQKTALLAAMLVAVLDGLRDEPRNRIFLWIDETEDLNLFPVRARRQLTSMWRDLVDSLPVGLSMYLNYTPAQGETGDIRQVLSQALISRITTIIRFEPLGEEDAVDFVTQLLNATNVRPKEMAARATSSTFPFEDDAIAHIISKLRFRTPRNINIAVGEVLRTALREDYLIADEDSTITNEFVDLPRVWDPIEDVMEREERLIG